MSTEAQRRAKKKYKASPKGQAAEHRYRSSENGKRVGCARVKRAYARNPGPAKERSRANRKAKYGLTQVTWDALFEAQGRRCASCGSQTSKRVRGGWATDHDHATGRVRGILCTLCNIALGACEDDPGMLVRYLENTK